MLNLAILGFAHGHVDMYANEIKKMDDARIVAGWDHDAERGAARCQNHACQFYSNLSDLLKQPDISGVIVGVETSMHAGVVEAAAKAGKNVLLQKPMALTLEDCDRMINAINSSDARFSMAWQMRCDPQNQWMREAIQSGLIGKVTLLRRRHGLSTQLMPNFEQLWHVKPELNKGMFMDDAAHPADLLFWLLGKPTSVMAEIDTLINPKVPDDTGMAIYRFPGGPLGVLECSFTCVAAEETTMVVGDKGTIIQSYGDAPSCGPIPPGEGALGLRYALIGDKNWTSVPLPSPQSHGERIRAVARPGVEFLLGKRAPIATAEEGRMNVKMLLSAYQSSEEGRRIQII